MQLKEYQKRTLASLEQFLAEAKLSTVEQAFAAALARQKMPPVPYRHYDFGQIPYVCLRLPTGGGKTVLGSHAVRVATRAWLEQDYPIVLWLVPTNIIQSQTLEALKQPGHPYREELDRAFDHRVRVLDIEEVTQIRPHDIGNQTIVVVSTLANLRVTRTSDRKVYAYHEDFEPHFVGVRPDDPRLERVTEDDLKENGLGPGALGKIKYSFANLLALHRPLVIMDEAHNARTPLTFETLKRVHPACVIEFTATPDVSATSASNVLYHVSASELKAEEMIKLPIMLTEHKNWQEAVRDAVLTRKRLAVEAQKEPTYIRPIVLFQAEPKNGTVTWEVLKQYLLDELKLDAESIAVATGAQRELDGIDLFSPDCRIEYIITVEALKEGWDLFGDEDGEPTLRPEEPPFAIELPAKPDFGPEHDEALGNITVSPTETGAYRLEAKGVLDERVAEELLKLFQGAERQEVRGQIEQHNARVEVSRTPSQRGIPFAPLPQLCLAQQGELELVEPETFLFLNGDWSPLDFPVELPGFALKETDTTFEVDVEGKHVVYHVAEEKETYNLNLVATDVTEADMVRWLDRQLRRQDVTQAVMIRYLSQLVGHLTKERGLTLTALVRGKFLLVRAIQRQLSLLRDKVADRGFQQALFENAVPLETSFNYEYRFVPELYPARIPFYRGRYKFAKHYYPVIEDLKGDGEEFDCAVAIDAHPAVKHWVRNLVDRSHASFRLPLSGGWFYPDFVAELHDGRLLVVEYKGAPYKTNDDSREKNAVGKLWADKSGGRCLFLMAEREDTAGRSVAVQIEAVINRK